MISLNWVKDYVDLDNIDLKDLATQITKAGVNVEKVISNHIDNLVVGQVLSCINHPDSDHLHICNVDVGNEIPAELYQSVAEVLAYVYRIKNKVS